MKKELTDQLYNLLPSIYRQRDEVDGNESLKELLSILESELRTIEQDIAGLYENWFIETCDEWVVPYIGDLVGAKLLSSVEDTTISQRAYVGNTIRYRRRKGTAPVLEQVAHDVTGWDARVVEFFQLLCTTQNINHKRLVNVRTPDLRDLERLELLDTPFDTIPHTVDVHNISTRRGYHNIPNIGVFLWRLQAYPVKRAPAFKYEEKKYSFSQIGIDIPLFNNPAIEVSITNFAEETNVPTPIRRRALKNTFPAYYGSEKSILLEEYDNNAKDLKPVDPVPIVCDLSNWDPIPNDKLAIDPVNGRIWNPENKQLYVTYYYGFSADIGGGFYHRDLFSPSENYLTYQISKNPKSKPDVFNSFSEAYLKWIADEKPNAIFEILDSDSYEIQSNAEKENIFKLELPKKTKEKGILVISAAQEQRPVLTAKANKNPDPLTLEISGEEGSRLIIDGLLLDGTIDVKITPGKHLNSLMINHSTLVPQEGPSISAGNKNDDLTIALYRSICGKIEIKNSEAKLSTKDTIIDGNVPAEKVGNAIECYEAKIENTTVFGEVNVSKLKLVSNSIFTNIADSKRRQEGCVRFSYVPEESQVPRRYRCQPESNADNSEKYATGAVYPIFTSKKYGDPGYAQLDKNVSKDIFEGADNEAEMGVFNHLYQSQRITNLQVNRAEYLRFGLELGIFLVT